VAYLGDYGLEVSALPGRRPHNGATDVRAPEDLRVRVEELAAAGVTHLAVRFPGRGSAESIEHMTRFASDIIGWEAT
jgi:hypothetical protein